MTLKDGTVVSLDALRLLWALEDRGCIIRRDGMCLLIGPRDQITDAERAQVRRHRDELLTLVASCETEPA